MHRDLDIIYHTLFPWENAYSSVSLSFTREFAKNNRVFYINTPYSVKDFFNSWSDPTTQSRKKDLFLNKMRYEQIPSLPDNVIAAHPPLTVPINFLPNNTLYNSLRKRNNQVVYNTIEKVIKDYQIKNYIYVNCFNPYTAGVLPRDRFNPLLNIYQCIDDMYEEPYTAKHGARLEEEIIRQSDLTFVTSTNLKKLKSPFNSNIFIVHNAADISIFKNAVEIEYPVPEDIAHINTKIIGFTGNLDPNRINYPLLKKIALAHQDKTLVLIGPISQQEFEAHDLHNIPNVVTTGPKNINDLPKYLQHMDCTIIPFSCNKLTASIYPLKINEYLAAARPVISTSFSDDIRGFSDSIYLADNDDTFLQLIDTAIAEDSETLRQHRIKVANSNTWTTRVEQFWDAVDQVLTSSVAN